MESKEITLTTNRTGDNYRVLVKNPSSDPGVYRAVKISNGHGDLFIKMGNPTQFDYSGMVIRVTKSTVYNINCEVIDAYEVLGATEINEMMMAIISMTGFYYYPTSRFTDGVGNHYLEVSMGGIGTGIIFNEGFGKYEVVVSDTCIPSINYNDFDDEENEFIASVFASMFTDEELYKEYLLPLDKDSELYKNNIENEEIDVCYSDDYLFMYKGICKEDNSEYYRIMYRPNFMECKNIIISNDDYDMGPLKWVELAFKKLEIEKFHANMQ